MSAEPSNLEARLIANLDVIVGEITAPARSRFERGLLACRVPEPTARLIAATPVLRWAWITAVAVVLFFAASAGENASEPGQQLAVFLGVAPLLPIAAVALSYGPRSDRSHEVALAAPLSGLRLLLLRTVTVVVAAAVVSGLTVLVAPTTGLLRLAWLLPGLATTSVTLAAGARWGIRRAALIVGCTWLLIVIAVAEASDDAIALYQPLGQFIFAVIALGAAAVLIAERRRFDHWQPT